MEAIDTVYEYAGYQAALALWAALTGLGLPLIVGLGGVAWRFLRVAEDGLVRPLLFYLLGLVVVWWLVTPGVVAAPWGIRAPRFASWLTSASDTVSRAAIRGIDDQFLRSPFEWERLAALAGTAYVTDENLAHQIRDFHKQCYLPAIARLEGPASESAKTNPLRADTGLPYERFRPVLNVMTTNPDAFTCATARQVIHDDVQRHMEKSEGWRAAFNAARNLRGPLDKNLYFDLLVANTINGRADTSDVALTRFAVGRYDSTDPAQNAMAVGGDAPGWFAGAFSWLLGELTRIIAPVNQATAAKTRYYRITTAAPQVYGLSTMLLLALFPIAALWALLPGGWRALVHFGKIYASVKLWPVGWCLLSTFTSRRPPSEAILAAGGSLENNGNLFVTASSMYFVVPVLCFIIVNIATSAVAASFREAIPSGDGGGRGAAVGGGVSAAAAA